MVHPEVSSVTAVTPHPSSGQGICLDISRLRQDTGYEPAYDLQTAVADYLAWLRAGHQR